MGTTSSTDTVLDRAIDRGVIMDDLETGGRNTRDSFRGARTRTMHSPSSLMGTSWGGVSFGVPGAAGSSSSSFLGPATRLLSTSAPSFGTDDRPSVVSIDPSFSSIQQPDEDDADAIVSPSWTPQYTVGDLVRDLSTFTLVGRIGCAAAFVILLPFLSPLILILHPLFHKYQWCALPHQTLPFLLVQPFVAINMVTYLYARYHRNELRVDEMEVYLPVGMQCMFGILFFFILSVLKYEQRTFGHSVSQQLEAELRSHKVTSSGEHQSQITNALDLVTAIFRITQRIRHKRHIRRLARLPHSFHVGELWLQVRGLHLIQVISCAVASVGHSILPCIVRMMDEEECVGREAVDTLVSLSYIIYSLVGCFYLLVLVVQVINDTSEKRDELRVFTYMRNVAGNPPTALTHFTDPSLYRLFRRMTRIRAQSNGDAMLAPITLRDPIRVPYFAFHTPHNALSWQKVWRYLGEKSRRHSTRQMEVVVSVVSVAILMLIIMEFFDRFVLGYRSTSFPVIAAVDATILSAYILQIINLGVATNALKSFNVLLLLKTKMHLRVALDKAAAKLEGVPAVPTPPRGSSPTPPPSPHTKGPSDNVESTTKVWSEGDMPLGITFPVPPRRAEDTITTTRSQAASPAPFGLPYPSTLRSMRSLEVIVCSSCGTVKFPCLARGQQQVLLPSGNEQEWTDGHGPQCACHVETDARKKRQSGSTFICSFCLSSRNVQRPLAVMWWKCGRTALHAADGVVPVAQDATASLEVLALHCPVCYTTQLPTRRGHFYDHLGTTPTGDVIDMKEWQRCSPHYSSVCTGYPLVVMPIRVLASLAVDFTAFALGEPSRYLTDAPLLPTESSAALLRRVSEFKLCEALVSNLIEILREESQHGGDLNPLRDVTSGTIGLRILGFPITANLRSGVLGFVLTAVLVVSVNYIFWATSQNGLVVTVPSM